MHDVVGELLTLHPTSIDDGRRQLIRIKDVPKQSTSKIHDESTHRGTIAINRDSRAKDLNKNKTVIILDDVWTTGCTLRVCKEVMLTTNPKQVKLLAIGKDVGKKSEEKHQERESIHSPKGARQKR